MYLPVDYTKLTPSQRKQVRELYVEIQEGACMYCEGLLTDPPPPWVMRMKVITKLFPPNFFTHPVHLQHNHKTGMTEGAVHPYCNAVLWQYEGR